MHQFLLILFIFHPSIAPTCFGLLVPLSGSTCGPSELRIKTGIVDKILMVLSSVCYVATWRVSVC
jgi:hypothetical protein